MIELLLKYKGYSHTMSFNIYTLYSKTEFEKGKTLYQILFEHLIDGEPISINQMVKKYKSINPYINSRSVNLVKNKLSVSISKSTDTELKKKKFKLGVKISLLYKGFSHNLILPVGSLYTRLEVEPRKTIYQVLFEHIIDKRPIIKRQLSAKYKKVNPIINAGSIKNALNRLESSISKSTNKRINSLKPIIVGSGGARIRKTPSGIGKLMPEQQRIVRQTIKYMTSRGKQPSLAMVQAVCLRELKKVKSS